MKLLYDTTTEQIKPYPRQDDEDVVGLDPLILSMQVIEQPKPDLNAATQYLERTEAIDLAKRIVTRSWKLAELPPPPPAEVTMIRLKDALIDAGLFQQITSAINGIENANQRLKAQIRWASSGPVRRDDDTLKLVALLAKQSDQQVDAIFAAAQKLDTLTTP